MSFAVEVPGLIITESLVSMWTSFLGLTVKSVCALFDVGVAEPELTESLWFSFETLEGLLTDEVVEFVTLDWFPLSVTPMVIKQQISHKLTAIAYYLLT